MPIRRGGGWSFDCTHPCKAALGRLAARIERKHLFQGMPLLGARFGNGGEQQPNLRQLGLLGDQGA
jgi:hypothetical protein